MFLEKLGHNPLTFDKHKQRFLYLFIYFWITQREELKEWIFFPQKRKKKKKKSGSFTQEEETIQLVSLDIPISRPFRSLPNSNFSLISLSLSNPRVFASVSILDRLHSLTNSARQREREKGMACEGF